MLAGAQNRRRGQRDLRGFFLRSLGSYNAIAGVLPFSISVDVRRYGKELPGQTLASTVVAAASETEVNPIPEQGPLMLRALVHRGEGLVAVVVVLLLLFEAARLVVRGRAS